jgi:Uma2 family endonuclease
MGAKAAISLEEYLHTSFPDLDKEFRDGELVERSMPDYIHGKTQAILVALFLVLRSKFRVFPSVETRMQLRPGLILIPDVSVFYPTEPERFPKTPPFVVIEVLSLDDRMTEVRDKLQEFKAWGVEHVWLVDPHGKRLYTCTDRLAEVASLKVPEFDLELTPAQIFG